MKNKKSFPHLKSIFTQSEINYSHAIILITIANKFFILTNGKVGNASVAKL